MIDSLSGGWQRRLDVALACIGNPRVLVLDEPTSGIDPVARGELWSCLRRLRSRGVGILVSTHDLGEAEAFADRLLVLNKGRLVLSGPVENVLSQAGGNWRIHLTGAGSGLAAFSDGDAPRFYVNGDSATAIGPKAAILRLSERLEQAHSTGGLPYQDILKGPIRLEDVFAYVVAKGESDV
jgi:ABC-2 type transport system ATP-binding protein